MEIPSPAYDSISSVLQMSSSFINSFKVVPEELSRVNNSRFGTEKHAQVNQQVALVVAGEPHDLSGRDNSPRSRQAQPPMPLIAYKDRSLLVVSKLWGPRLSPGKMSADVQWALEEAHLHLPSTCHEALCYVAWSFQANPTDELDWDFYQFTFHESLESTSHPDFNKVAEYWSKLGGAKVEANEVEFYWKQTIGALGIAIKERLSTKDFPFCLCSIQQPHSYHDLQRSVELLTTLDKSERVQRATQVDIACTSLRVFDIMEAEFGDVLHDSRTYAQYRKVVRDVLRELQLDEELPPPMQVKLKTAIAYEFD